VAVLLVSLAGVVGRAVWIQRQPVVLASQDRLDRSVRASVYLAVRVVENYRAQHGRHPSTLGEAGEEDLDVTYTLQGETYTVTASVGGVSATYRSGDDLAPFIDVFPLIPDAP
jgi:hypothetical protein